MRTKSPKDCEQTVVADQSTRSEKKQKHQLQRALPARKFQASVLESTSPSWTGFSLGTRRPARRNSLQTTAHRLWGQFLEILTLVSKLVVCTFLVEGQTDLCSFMYFKVARSRAPLRSFGPVCGRLRPTAFRPRAFGNYWLEPSYTFAIVLGFWALLGGNWSWDTSRYWLCVQKHRQYALFLGPPLVSFEVEMILFR